MKRLFIILVGAGLLMACHHNEPKTDTLADTAALADTVEEEVLDTTPRPMFLFEVTDNQLQMLYWANIEKPKEEDFGDSYYIYALDSWEKQEKFRRHREEYTNLLADSKVVKIQYVDELLKDPDGNPAGIGEMHGRSEIPSMGARYKMADKKDNSKLFGGQVAVTDSYLACHTILPVKEKGSNEGLRRNSAKLPKEVVRQLEERYGMKALKSSVVCDIDGRYTFGSLQFKGEYKNAPKDEYDRDRKSCLALDVLVVGDKVYAYEAVGYYDNGFCTWNADDDGEYIPTDIEAAFEGRDGIELCFKRYAPESVTTGLYTVQDDRLVKNEYDCYHVLVDEERPIWKKDIDKHLPSVKKQIAERYKISPKEVSFTEYTLVSVDWDDYREVYVRDKNKDCYAVFSVSGKKPEILAVARGGYRITFYNRCGLSEHGSCGSGCQNQYFHIVSDSKVVESFGRQTFVDPEGNRTYIYTKGGGAVIDQDEFQQLYDKIGEEREDFEKWLEWKKL